MNTFMLELRNTWKSVMIGTIVFCGLTFFILAFFPSMQTDAMQQLAGAKLEGIDPVLLAAFGLGELFDFTLITNFFGYVLQYLTIAVMIFIMQFAVNSLVKEETDGTIELLYSRPISRSHIFIQKAAANISVFAALLAVLSITTIAGYLLFTDYTLTASVKEAGILYGSMLYVGLIYLAVGMLLSAVLKSSKSTSGVVLAAVFGTYILGITSIVVERLSFLRYFSPMEWIKIQKLLKEGILPVEWLIGIAVIVVSFAAAHGIYQKRDLRL
ncbi:MAG TPA: ABC transporter permease subunit [Firmicutes bacterium]|jgi:ABC-2 type transport system permease protein|nr:ABC transporter permease subunit [Bacillota bacterium]